VMLTIILIKLHLVLHKLHKLYNLHKIELAEMRLLSDFVFIPFYLW